MLTEVSIKAKIRHAPNSGRKQIVMKDAGPRGAGRLALVIRPMSERVSAEWYAVYFRGGRRETAKIGTYPEIPLAAARQKFRDEYMPAIVAGGNVKAASVVAMRRHGGTTVKALFEAYVKHLESRGATGAKQARHVLLDSRYNAADALGRDRLASSITPGEISAFLGTIFQRGKRTMAAQVRAYIGAAYSWACAAKNDYTSAIGGVDLGIDSNPVANIPADHGAIRQGTRALSAAEVRAFYLWLEQKAKASKAAIVLMLRLLTGQRGIEIQSMCAAGYSSAEAIYHWEKTKNGSPHTIPLPRRAVAILDSLAPNEHGLFFPHKRDPARGLAEDAAQYICREYIEESGCEHFCPRDIRRTWKTLAGRAGLSKELRDRLQNHSRADVSARHYDRYDYMAEKREGMAKWEAFFDDILAGRISD